jgi:predicted DNA-binding protein
MENIPQSKHESLQLKPIQVRLPQELTRRLKIVAAETGSTLTEIMRKAVEQYLEARRAA